MIGFIRRRKSREFVFVRHPVKISAVNDTAAHSHCMSVHILCRGMCYDIRAPGKRAAVDRSCERIVNDQRNAMLMREPREFFDIKYNQ